MDSLEKIFNSRKVVTVAEIGLNHGGDIALAKRLILEAKEAGADAVKFQTMVPENFFSRYGKSLLELGSEKFEDYGTIDFFKKLMFTDDEWTDLKSYSDRVEIEFFSTPFDDSSVELLERLGVRLYKIASSDMNNVLLQWKIKNTGKPVILSTGMSAESEIDTAVNILKGNELILLHCVSLYPTELEFVNLKRIASLRKKYKCWTGFSDHSKGIESVVGAVFSGAVMIEKHFMGDSNDKCVDASVSLDKKGFMEMTNSIKKCVCMSGSGDISSSDKENHMLLPSRRSFFAARNISVGEIFDENNLIAKRPGTGIPVNDFAEIKGKRCVKPLSEDHMLRWENLG